MFALTIWLLPNLERAAWIQNDIILTVTQIEPRSGRIGLFASTFDEGGVQITFDEVLIRNP